MCFTCSSTFPTCKNTYCVFIFICVLQKIRGTSSALRCRGRSGAVVLYELQISTYRVKLRHHWWTKHTL